MSLVTRTEECPRRLLTTANVDPSGEHQRRSTVAKVVQPHRPQAGARRQPREHLGDLGGGEFSAVLPGEQPVVIPVARRPLGALEVLAEPVGQQRADRALADVDPPVLAAARLRLALADLDQLRPEKQHTGLEVDVGPARRTCLAAAQAGEGQDLEPPSAREALIIAWRVSSVGGPGSPWS